LIIAVLRRGGETRAACIRAGAGDMLAG